MNNKFPIIALFVFSLIIGSIDFSLIATAEEQGDKDKRQTLQFCPFGVCMGADPKPLFQNNQNGFKSSVDVPVASMILPPNPRKLLGDNYPLPSSKYTHGLHGISYDMYFTESSGVCMIGLSAGFKNSMLDEFYKNLSEYLSIEIPKIPMGSEERHLGKFDWYRLKGDDVAHLEGIEEIFISTGGFVDGDRKISNVSIWFNNSSECIEQYPVLNWRNEHYELN